MELHDRYHLENISRNFLQASTVLSPLKDPSHCTGTSLYQSLGCSRIPSVTMATKDTVTSSEQDDTPSPPSSTIKGSLTLSPEQQVRRMSLLHNRKTSHEEDQSTINNYYNWCKSNNSISTSFQSPNQLSRSPRVVSNSQHQCNRKCNVRRRCNSSTYLTNSNSANNNPRTINTVCWPAHPVSCEGTSSSLPQQASPQQPTTTRRWSITNLYPRSRSTSPSDSQALAPSNVEHCNDTSLASSSPALCSSSKLFTQKNGSRRRRPLSHLSRLGGRSSDHSTADTKSQRSWSSHELSLRGDGNLLLGLENHHRHDSAADVNVATACATSLLLLPAPYTGCNSPSAEGSSRVPMNLDDTENSSSSKAQFAGSRQVSSQHSSEIPQTCSTSSSPSPVPALAMSSVDSNIPPLRPRENLVPSAEDRNVESQLPTGKQHERVTQISPKRRRIISKRSQTVHPLLSLLWNLITWFTSSSSPSSNRPGASTPINMSQVWTFLLSVMLVVTVLPNVAECCSSRSTPRPRPSSPTLRPNITFQTYACPPAYAAWYCLNGATCFTVKIGESILYNCECADGYMGQRCEFKDLDGSYLPTREKVLLETASIAGGATVVIVLVFFVIFSVFLVKNKDKENRDLEGLSRINININSGAASSWPANSDGPHQPPSFSQRTSHTFVTSTTGTTSPHTTTISSPPHHMQPGYNRHHDQAPAAAAESVVDGKRFVPDQLGGGGGTTMLVDGGHKGRGVGTNTAGEAFYGVPARVVRTVTTITDLASIYTHPRQEVHQVEVLQQVNVLKVDQSKACYNATFVRPSSNASTTALYRGAMWQEAPSNNSPGGKDSPLSWQQFKAMSGLSSLACQTPQNQLSVMPHTPSASSDRITLDPEVSHVVVPVSEQVTRVAHSGVTLAMASHAVDLNNPEQYQPSSTTLMLANSKMPFQPRLGGDENDSSTTVYISSDETRVKDQSMDESSEDHTANCFVDHNDDESSRAIGAVNEAFDSEEENIMNQGCGDGPQRLPFSATNTDRY